MLPRFFTFLREPVRERDEISTAHCSHTHHRPKTKHCSHRGAIVCAAAVDILTRASGDRQYQGASSSLREQGPATNGAEAPSFAPAQSTSLRKRVTTDDAEAPRHRRAIRGHRRRETGGGGEGKSSPGENEECTKGGSQQMDKGCSLEAYDDKRSGW